MTSLDSDEHIEILKVSQLKTILKNKGLPTTGNKQALITRIRDNRQTATMKTVDTTPMPLNQAADELRRQELKIQQLQLELEILKTKSTMDNTNLERLIDISSLPRPAPPKFDGDPLNYPRWKAAFDTLVDQRNLPPREKIYFLQSYLSEKALKCVEGLLMIGSDNSYERAMSILDKRFGDKFRVGNAFIAKLTEWPNIKPKDSQGLEEFSDFLNQCNEARESITRLSKLDDCEEILKIARKLPDWAKSKWSNEASNFKEKNGNYPAFQEFAKFVEKEATRTNDPFLSLNSLQTNQEKAKVSITERNKSTVTKSLLRPMVTTLGMKATEDTSFETKKRCDFCHLRNHDVTECRNLSRKSYEDKQKFIRDNKLCYACLKTGHQSTTCQNKATCKRCNQKHPTSLHFNTQVNKSNVQDELSVNRIHHSEDEQAESTAHRVHNEKDSTSMTTMIVPVWLSTKTNQEEQLVYALIDTQSDTSFIEESLTESIMNRIPTSLSISTLTGVKQKKKCYKLENVQIRRFDGQEKVSIHEVFTTPSIPIDTDHIATPETISKWPHLADLKDKLIPRQDCPVGLLIGYNCSEASRPLEVRSGKYGEPYGIETPLGWSIVGGPRIQLSDDSKQALAITHRAKVNEVSQVDVLRSLEDNLYEDLRGQTTSQQDLKFIEILRNEIQLVDGYYTMPLPFKSHPQKPSLPDNREYAIHRLKLLQRKFANEDYFQEYNSFMDKMIENGEAVEVPEDEIEKSTRWYIPHHGVIHHTKKKLRIVFDCSSKYRGESLNDKLLDGPDLSNNLVGVLHRFRQHRIAFTADIERMFYRFKVPEEDQDYLRFVWSKNEKVLDYKMTVHLFGASSSPSCCNFGFKQLAQDHIDTFQEASRFISRNFYIDDGLMSLPTEEEAVSIVKQTRELCKLGNLRLHKFASNSKEVLNSLPATEIISLEKEQPLPSLRTLGLIWNMEEDYFTFGHDDKQTPATRRGILSKVSSIFDPLGFLAPYTLIGKRLLQRICMEKISWDEPLSHQHQEEWRNWSEELTSLHKLKVPRCVQNLTANTPLKVIELHSFSDASLDGIGQCSYLKTTDADGITNVSLVMAKSKVAPQKVTTIPRLELVAALLSVKVATSILGELDFQDIKPYFWTDSQTVINYINNDSKRFHTFVSNRVQEIRRCSEPQQWYHIKSSLNPADKVSRGKMMQSLVKDDEWINGPKFLYQPSKQYLLSAAPQELSVQDPEVRTTFVYMATCEAHVHEGMLDRFTKFSTWMSLVTAVASLLSIALRYKGEPKDPVDVRKKAKKYILQHLQRYYFEDDIAQLEVNKSVDHMSQLFKLEPYLDEDNLIRVGGRLKFSEGRLEIKHPIILPKKTHITTLIIDHCHKAVAHQGRTTTLNKIRYEGFHILAGTRAVSSFIYTCVSCRKLRGNLSDQRMADLPEARCEPAPPFTIVGYDCMGPFIIKEGRKELKRYVVLFTCYTSRGVHLEMLNDLTADSFINALRCLIAIRGRVQTLRSDRGSNFRGASTEYTEALKEMEGERLQTFLSRSECRFEFNTPSSSHMGGLWERMVRTSKSVLKGVLMESSDRLDTSGFRTILYEVMSIINSRPITQVNPDSTDLEALTPNHLLCMKATASLPPPGNFTDEDIGSRKQWRRVQAISEQFWHRWRAEYLSQIRLRQKWFKQKENFRVGDVVYLKDDNALRNQWRLGRVEVIHPSADGLVRKCTLSVVSYDSQNIIRLERPVAKCILLCNEN